MEKRYNDLIGDILENSGGKDNYQGKWKGKPMSKDYFELDTFQQFQKIAKDAGFLPQWLRLQKEISSLVHACKCEKDVEVINSKIKKHNKICPIPLQKNLIHYEDLEEAKKIW